MIDVAHSWGPDAGPDTTDSLLAVLEASPSPVVVLDLEGRVVFANDRTLRSFGWTRTDLLGRHVDTLVPEHLAPLPVPVRGHAGAPGVTPGSIRTEELTARRRDGSRFPVQADLSRVPGPGGGWLLLHLTDLSERRDYDALARMNEAILRATTVAELFDRTCEAAVEAGGYLGVCIGRAGSAGRLDVVSSAGELDDFFDALEIDLDPDSPLGQGPTAIALRDGRSTFCADYTSDPLTAPWHELGRAYGVRASAHMPLRCGGRVVAMINLYSSQPHVFDGQMRRMLESLVDNVSYALDQFDVGDRLAAASRARAFLLDRLVAAQEEERSRIAADVHDDSVQALAAVDLRLGLLARRVAQEAPGLTDHVEQIQDQVGGVTHGLRHLLFELEAAEPGLTVVDMLESAAGHVFEDLGVDWRVELVEQPGDPALLRLPDTVTGQVLRIVKEALGNVRKHARASTVSMQVTAAERGVEIAIVDDGLGGQQQPESRPGHRGLTTMRDRAELCGGWCTVTAGPGTFEVRFWVPRNP